MHSKKKGIVWVMTALMTLSSSLYPVLRCNAANASYEVSDSYSKGIYYQRLLNVPLTGNQVTDLISIAKSQVGYHEGSSATDLSGESTATKNKYSEYAYAHGNNNQDWCAYFVSWCARQAGISTTIIPKTGGCGTMRNNAGRYIDVSSRETPQAGDLFLLEPYDSNKGTRYIASRDSNGKATISGHIGIITEVKDGRMYFVEGNAGECVHESSIPIQNSRGNKYWIQGYLRPNYTGTPAATPVPTQKPVSNSVTVTATKEENVTATNAKLYGSCNKTSGVNIFTCGVYLGTSENTMQKLNTETVPAGTNSHNKGKSFDIWYDLNSELKVNLTPGVTYYYKFFCTYDNKEYTSNVRSFTTQGTHECNGITYIWSSDYSSCTANRTCSAVAEHNQTETAYSTVNTTPATYTSEGSIVYTANFSNSIFQTQTYTQKLPALMISDSDIRVTATDATKVTQTNATLNGRCQKPSSEISIETCGLYLGTNALEMNKVNAENVPVDTNQHENGTGFDIWYDLNSELNVTLTKGTTYYYKFYCTYQGKEFVSEVRSFSTAPQDVAISKVKAYKKSVLMSWKMNSSADGYQIQYSKDPTFQGAKKIWVRENYKIAKWMTKLTGSTTYYIRIRAYKDAKVDGKTTRSYSSWNSVVTKTK